MNAPTRTRPGHWADQHIPTTAEIAAADEMHASTRPPFAAVGSAFVAFLFLIALVIWLARFFLKG